MNDTQPVGQSSKTFWWVRHDWWNYKVPVSEGKVLIAQDIQEPGFEIDPKSHWYSFVHSRKDDRKIGDFSGWMSAAFFVNERTFGVFEDMFAADGRIVKVRCSDEPHYIVLIDTTFDAMDLERSEFERLDMYPDLARDTMRTLRVVLKDDFNATADIFRTGPKRLKFDLVVSDAFKTRYEQAGLTGLLFRETSGN